MNDFTETSLRDLKRVYARAFSRSQLRIATGSGLTLSDILHHKISTEENTDTEKVDSVNVVLLPDYDCEHDSIKFSAKLSFDHFVGILKRKIFSIQPRPLFTLAKQTEKTWLISSHKCWDNVKNCQHYHEYNARKWDV